MELVLVRHAQPAWRAQSGLATNDPGLTPLGHEQATKLALWMAQPQRPRVDGLFMSTARRSQQTAAILGEALGLTAVLAPWLVEIGSPEEWEGTPEDEVVATLNEMKARPLEDWWDGAPGGESFRDFHARVTDGIEGFLARFGAGRHQGDPARLWDVPDDGPRLVLVAHAGTNSVLTSHLLGIAPQPWEWERFATDHASVTVLRSRPIADGDIWALEYFSDVGHLAPDQVTA
ncbi:MAG TPA: histidine phosphatase family protein [Euzebya sp.]|nr:histidine phosphatase family protein [Euzebya sp.]